MILNAPMIYTATTIKRGHKNEASMVFGEWVALEVVETTSADAPVALRWEKIRYLDDVEPKIVETRWFNDHHYLPVSYDDDRTLSDHGLMEACAKGENPKCLPYQPEYSVMDFIRGALKSIDETPLRTVIKCDRDERRAKMEEAAERLLLIDGQVWQKLEEPTYAFLRHHGGVRVHIRGSDSNEPFDSKMHFRADRLNDLLDHFDINNEAAILERIDVLIPESIRYDDETPALLAAAAKSVEWFASRLSKHSTDFLTAWGRLRDAVTQGAPSPEAAQEVADRLEDFANVSYDPDDWYTQQMRKALRRWSLRPIYDVDIHFDSASSP